MLALETFFPAPLRYSDSGVEDESGFFICHLSKLRLFELGWSRRTITFEGLGGVGGSTDPLDYFM